LVLQLQGSLDAVWRARNIRYNQMLKDFKNAPRGYVRVVSSFENW
jgi:hypothetical protein